LGELFHVKSGDFHSTSELDTGNTALISCGETNNGLVGYFDIPEEFAYQHTLTVAYNGQPLTTKFHPYKFGAKDDVAVLLPYQPMQDTTLLYVASQLNSAMWRYSYGRKCFREKLRNVAIFVPIKNDWIDEKAVANFCPPHLQEFWNFIKNASQQLTAD
jgi:hypothetical protein